MSQYFASGSIIISYSSKVGLNSFHKRFLEKHAIL
jgi:hypothetical protein